MTQSSNKRGGRRIGAGRPKGSGKFQEPTKSVRIPIPLLSTVEDMLGFFSLQKRGYTVLSAEEVCHEPSLPLFSGRVQAGFPTAADDHIDEKMNLHDHVVQHREATFFVKVKGDSMIQAHIQEGDILVVDRALIPKDGSIVIAVLNGELTVKRLSMKKDGRVSLVAENASYSPIHIREGEEIRIFGVVTFVLHKC